MNGKALVLALILVFSVSLIVSVCTIQVATANFFPGNALLISSPTSGMVYTNTSIPLILVANVANPTPEIVSIAYSLDENPNVTLTNLNKTLRLPSHIDGSQFFAELVLENLSEGNHTLKAYSQDDSGVQMSASVEFMIDIQYQIPLLVLSPQNITYYTTEVPLTFVCSEEFTFVSPDYVLDGMGMGPISGNLTLTGLSLGKHEITVIVWTVRGVFSQTVYFSVSEPESFPITLVISSLIALVAVGLGFLVYLKRRRR
jgi:hypothetical protein